jgi:hypothetical protein
VKEPKHQQSEWKSQNESAKQGVPEPIIGIEAKKIFEVWREGADQQSRKDEREASKREGGSTVC